MSSFNVTVPPSAGYEFWGLGISLALSPRVCPSMQFRDTSGYWLTHRTTGIYTAYGPIWPAHRWKTLKSNCTLPLLFSLQTRLLPPPSSFSFCFTLWRQVSQCRPDCSQTLHPPGIAGVCQWPFLHCMKKGVDHTCNPSIREAEVGGWRVWQQSGHWLFNP